MVTFDITVELYNTLPSGGRDFLSAGEKPLPTLYLVAFFCYLSAGITWVWCLWRARQSSEAEPCTASFFPTLQLQWVLKLTNK